MITKCRMLALEGPPGSGKTTTAFALSSLLKRRGLAVEYCEESSRRNAFVEDYTLHNQQLNMGTELQLFCATIADQLLATRHNDYLVCDKTPASLLAYSHVLLGDQMSPADVRLLDSMRSMFRQWCTAYAKIFLLQDQYGGQSDTDKVRAKVSHLQKAVSERLYREFELAEVQTVSVPTGIEVDERARWMAEAAGLDCGSD